MSNHQLFMQRCIQLATLGAGYVSPNPMVGSVIVYEGTIVGEGWHQNYGGPHAEVNAIQSVKNEAILPEATLYVNLEPCAHTGKTPPCANLIIAKKIKRVVVGCSDPNPLVAGKGIQLLRNAGIEVIENILQDDCLLLNKRFFTYIQKKRPYIILKWAQTRNGFLSPDASKMSAEAFEEERHITGFVVQKLVHKWRTMEDAIMVGTNTALTDNPALNARAWVGNAPARVVLDQNLRLPVNLKLFDQTQETYILNGRDNQIKGSNHYLKLNFAENWWQEALGKLHENQIQSMVVEGGAQLLNHILAEGTWDEAIVFYSPKHISNGIAAPAIGGKLIYTNEVDGMLLNQYLNA